MNEALQTYVRKFSTLRQGVSVHGPAPHKPVLLLTVLRGVEESWINDNRILLSPELVCGFKSIWQQVVTTEHSPLIAQPFFYLRSEKFWHHIPNPGFEEWLKITRRCSSIGVLNKAVAYVQLDPELFALLLSPAHRQILKETLLNCYFGGGEYVDLQASDYLLNIEKQIMEGSSHQYATEYQRLQASLDKNSFEEEVFIRGGMFKRKVPLIYSHSCCISGLRVETTVNASLLDACHIVPFSASHDDTITNGLALCPTLHRAFDRGLVAVDPEQYTLRVSKRLHEPKNSVYSIQQFHGQKIKLPSDKRYWPAPQNLASHLDRFAANF
ncbi:HNH endonuclease [Kiritimatiellaeota bacterium B1221]|nr:HNH endonuclease [Kiritimatiellaeota bacterium B1221]